MRGCRAWYLLPLMWLFVAGSVVVYAMHRGDAWAGWFGWLAGNGDAAAGDLLAGLIVLVVTLVGHRVLHQHILCAHCSASSRAAGEPSRYRHIAPREPPRYTWSDRT